MPFAGRRAAWSRSRSRDLLQLKRNYDPSQARVPVVMVLRCHKAKPFTQVEGLPVMAGATFSVRGYGSLPGEGKEHVIDDLGHESAGDRPTPKAQFAVEDIDR